MFRFLIALSLALSSAHAFAADDEVSLVIENHKFTPPSCACLRRKRSS